MEVDLFKNITFCEFAVLAFVPNNISDDADLFVHTTHNYINVFTRTLQSNCNLFN